MPTRYWHPFADMRGAGAWIEDADGHRYLDAAAGLWYCNVGHGRAEIAAAAACQLSNGDIHADPAYRAAMAAVYARRAIETALARAG